MDVIWKEFVKTLFHNLVHLNKDEYFHIFLRLKPGTLFNQEERKETLKDGEKGPRVSALASVATLKMFEVISPIR